MILPVALVDRWPGDRYRAQHATIESALKHNVADARTLSQTLKELRRIERTLFEPAEDEEAQQAQKYFKNHKDQTIDRKFAQYIISIDQQLERCIKFNDYAAMVMAAYPESRFLDKSRYWEECDNFSEPVLLRGIANAKIASHAAENHRDYYFIETGYLGNYRCANNLTGRKIYHRIVKNAMQHANIMDVPDDRYRKLVRFNPALKYRGWRQPGSKILLVLNTTKPFEHYGEDRDTWIKNTIDTIKAHTDREIVIREKAGRGERTNNTIYDALDDDVWALVTYNSIAAVEAIQHGIPAFALAPTAAAPVCSNDLTQIETPVRPSEDLIYRWLSSIAYGQFSLSEMLSGRAWEIVLENNERPTISC